MLEAQFSSRRRRFALSLSGLVLLAACDGGHDANLHVADDPSVTPPGSQTPDPSGPAGDPAKPPVKPLKTTPESFISDLVASTGGKNTQGNVTSSADAGAASAPTTADSASGAVNGSLSAPGAAERAISEADIVQVSGDTLYALSRVAGLTMVDMSDPAHLRVLGSYRDLPGTPFEMYLRDGVVLAMYSNYGSYVRAADGSYDFVQTSEVVALDTSNPASIQAISHFDIAGEISDSRLVGDVMYVVGYQNGYCWNCDKDAPQTSVLSLDVHDPRAVHKVDELKFADASSASWGRRSISVTAQRMYVAGPEYGSNQPTGSTIQVVDIADPGGDLVEGTSVRVDGMITNRWQMDEYQGVLRVVSQPGSWWFNSNAGAPTVQTYRVNSSTSLSALGNTTLNVPTNETLQAVRFDGPRGYAITAQRTDPLITIDLSDPAHPAQRGELHMPGSLYYMEPRGNRLIGLGFDQGNSAGSVTVSVFDVTNLSAPSMLDRVNFGGSWASLPEDQDRIQKSFKVLDDKQLILVPFSGWSGWTDPQRCESTYQSGIQLVDFAADNLTLRGMAPARGEARRALLHRDRLFALSDEALDSFDISDRDHPRIAGGLTIARDVSNVLPLDNGVVARINQDWYQRQNSTVDFVALADVAKPDTSIGQIDLSAVLADQTSCNTYTYVSDAFASGSQVNILFSRYRYWSGGYQSEEGIATIDASDPAHPKLAARIAWPTQADSYPWYPYYSGYIAGYVQSQASTVRTATSFVRLEQRWLQDPTTNTSKVSFRVRVVDLRDPAHPVGSTLTLPDAQGYSGLVVNGADVLFTHHVPDADGLHTRFYVSRIDLTDPSAPVLGDDVNVPGALLEYDAANQRGLYSEIVRNDVDNLTRDACSTRFAIWTLTAPDFYDDTKELRGLCSGYSQKLDLVRFVPGGAVRDDSIALADTETVSNTSVGGGLAMVVLSPGYGGYLYGPYYADVAYGYGYGFGYGGYGSTDKPAQILTLAGFDTGTFASGRLTVEDHSGNPWWGFWNSPTVYAHGAAGLVIGAQDGLVLDTHDATSPSITRTIPLFGYVNDVATQGGMVLIAEGMQGVQRIDL